MSKKEMSQQEKMVRGTLWSAAGNFASRLLGVVYVIPWYMWMGEHANEANALFNMGYNIYSLFLQISTSGLNVAIAKQIAKYNAMGREEESIVLTRQFLKLMLGVGIISAAIMYLFAGSLAQVFGGDNRLIPVIQSLSLAILVFPTMSIIRGVFQGYNDLAPFALSQIAEQIVRVIWMLLTVYMIMQLGSGDYISAVTQSTFAAFIGMIASIVVLIYFLAKSHLLVPLFRKSKVKPSINIKYLILETLKEAVPFVIIGAALQIFSLIDQISFSQIMMKVTDYSKDEILVQFSYFSSNPNKVVMILISIASSIGGVGIALITENYVTKNMKAAGQLIANNIHMLYLILLPAITGALILAYPLHTVFYGEPSIDALALFVVAIILSLVMSFYTILAPMLQALFENKKAVQYFLYGLLVKVITQIPLVLIFYSFGPLISTLLGLLVPIYLMYREIQRITRFNQRELGQKLNYTVAMTVMMGVLVSIVVCVLHLILPISTRLTSGIYLLIGGTSGILIYGYMTLKTRMIDSLIGSKAIALRNKLHIK